MARISVDLPEHFPFEMEIPIRIGDINYGGHLAAVRLESRSSFDLYYRLSDISDDREIARVKTGIAFFDYTKRKVTRIPDAFRDAILHDD